jgi:polyhydroxyalkanoate depolymerase
VPVLAAASLLASSGTPPFASVALLGGPIDTRLHPTSVDRFASSQPLRWFRDNLIDEVPPPYRGAGRRVYPGFVQQAAIVTAHPARQLSLEARYWSNWLSGDLHGAQTALRSLNEYAAVLDMSEGYFLDMLRVVFQEHLLARGAWSIDGQCVDTGALGQVPLCTIEGDCDDITGAGQTHCAHALCHAPDAPGHRRMTVAQCDHYDLFTGPRWRDEVHLQLCGFWRAIELSRDARVEPAAGIR